jgi:hypothetical protein
MGRRFIDTISGSAHGFITELNIRTQNLCDFLPFPDSKEAGRRVSPTTGHCVEKRELLECAHIYCGWDQDSINDVDDAI